MYMFWEDFLPVCGLPFHSSKGVFHRAEVFNFSEVQLFFLNTISSFTDCKFGGASKKPLSNSGSPGYSPVLSSRSFIVLHFTLRSMIHFKLIFVKHVVSVSRFFQLFFVGFLSFFSFLACMPVPIYSSSICWRLSFHYWGAFALLLKISWLFFKDLFLGYSAIPFHWSTCLFFCKYHIVLSIVAYSKWG